MVNTIFFIVVALVAILGFFRGFGKVFASYTRGISGFIISIIVCIALGGMIKNIPIVETWLKNLNSLFTEKVSFLAGWGAVTIFYLALFIVVQIVKGIFAKMIIAFFEANNILMKIINKVLGVIFAVGMFFLVMWLLASLLDLIQDGKWLDGILTKLQEKGGNIFVEIVKWNPMKQLFSL